MDQPTAERALKEMEVLVGEWRQTATPAGGEPWPGEGKASFRWLEGGQLLLERSTVEMPEAPDGVCVYGCDAANGTYYQLYTDDRNVCRVYQMSIGNGEWKLWREGEPFNQRFTATISEDGNRIEGRWEYDEGDGWKTDFDLVYTRVSYSSRVTHGFWLLPMVGMRSEVGEAVVEVVRHDDVSRRNDGVDAVRYFAVQANLGRDELARELLGRFGSQHDTGDSRALHRPGQAEGSQCDA